MINDSGNKEYDQRLLIATPTLGNVRIEWVTARYNQIVPTNWSKTDLIQILNPFIPLRYTVHDAQNLAIQEAIKGKFEWLLLVEDDTIPPENMLFLFNHYMDKKDIPVVSGLYFTRSIPPEPLIYRGRGNHYFSKWKLGDKVWVDGVPTGMLLLSTRLLKAIYDDSPEYKVGHSNQMAHRVFTQPAQSWFNEEKGAMESLVGTSDLEFCTRIIKGNYLEKAGYPKIAKMKYPYLIDTNIYCRHIDRGTGVQFPVDFPPEFIPQEGEKYHGKEIKD